MKLQSIRRILCAATAILCVTGMIACQNGSVPPKGENESAGTAGEGTDTPWNDHLPEADFKNAPFRISVYGPQECTDKFFVSGTTGSLINDAVFNKVATVEDRFNVDIQFNDVYAFTSDDMQHLVRSIHSGDDVCELAQGHDLTTANCALEGMFLNVLDLPHLDFSQPWWPSETIESMTVAGQIYLMFNNISYTSLAQTRVMFFNKSMLSELDLDDPYQFVYDGTWTLEQMRIMSNEAYFDLNGNQRKDNDDRLGFAHGENYCILETFSVEPYKKDKDGMLYYEMEIERLHDIVTTLAGVSYGVGGLIVGGEDNAEQIFSDGRALFTYTNLHAAITDFSQANNLIYGILPMPKLDESQKSYGAGATDRPIVVPNTAEDRADMVGIITEALNIEGSKQVYPAYFEISMKSRYADQTDDAKMLDIIHENTVISFTYLYGRNRSAYNTMLNDLFHDKSSVNSDVASWAARTDAAQRRRVEELRVFFETHANS